MCRLLVSCAEFEAIPTSFSEVIRRGDNDFGATFEKPADVYRREEKNTSEKR